MVNTDPDPDLIALLEADREVLLRLTLRSVSHMLGTPLQVIGGHAALLARLPGAQKSAETIQRKTGETAGELQSLIDYAGVTPAEPETVDVGALLASTVQALHRVSKAEGVAFEQQQEKDVTVRASRRDISHACLSLLLAAVRLAAPSGQVRIRLSDGTPEVPRRDAGFVREGAPMVLIDVDVMQPNQAERNVDPRRHPWLDGDPKDRQVDLGLAITAGLAREAGGWLGHGEEAAGPALRLAWPTSPA